MTFASGLVVDLPKELVERQMHRGFGDLKALRADPSSVAAIPPDSRLCFDDTSVPNAERQERLAHLVMLRILH